MQGRCHVRHILAACLIVAGLLVLSGCTQHQDPTIVQTGAGAVSGINQSGIRVYLGIPFAAPPVGDLRWKPPAPDEDLLNIDIDEQSSDSSLP